MGGEIVRAAITVLTVNQFTLGALRKSEIPMRLRNTVRTKRFTRILVQNYSRTFGGLERATYFDNIFVARC